MSRLLEPIRGRILLKEIKKEESAGGIKLPGNRYSVFSEGEVIAIGPGFPPGFPTSDGKLIKPGVNVGDTVLYAAEGPGIMSIDFEGEEYVILLDDSYVLSIIKETKNDG